MKTDTTDQKQAVEKPERVACPNCGASHASVEFTRETTCGVFFRCGRCGHTWTARA